MSAAHSSCGTFWPTISPHAEDQASPNRLSRESWSGIYLMGQSLAGLLWWGWLCLLPEYRDWFNLPHAKDTSLFAFFGADVLLFVIVGFICGVRLLRGESYRTLLLVHAGSVWYAGLHAWGVICVSYTIVWGPTLLLTGPMLMLLFIVTSLEGDANEAPTKKRRAMLASARRFTIYNTFTN